MWEYRGNPAKKADASKKTEIESSRLSDQNRIVNARARERKKENIKKESKKENSIKEKSIKEKNWHSKRNLPDYSVYQMSEKEWVISIGKYLLLDICISYLFFCSWIPFFLFLPCVFLFVKVQKQDLMKKRETVLKQQFLDGIQMMSSALAAGYSAENALTEALKELKKVYEPEDCIIREFGFMEAQISMNQNMEELLLDFGRRSGVEDIRSFAEVFMTAKRSGGDLLLIIRNTVSCIRQKQETMQEIETCLSGKVMEQNIMSMIPILILLYVKLTSPEFLEGMYGNTAGTVIMGICLAVYAAAYFWGRSIIRIEV